MTTATTDAGAVGPGRGGRMSRPREREAVLRLPRGEGLGGSGPAGPSPRQRRVLDLARSFAVLSRRQQEALCMLARALADEPPGPEGAGREAA